MAFSYLDEDCIESDDFWHSFVMKTWLQNVRQIGEERWCKGSAMFVDGWNPNWHAPYEVAYGPYYLYCPDHELNEIEIIVYHDGITYSPGGQAIELAATLGGTNPLPGDWTAHNQTAVAGAISMTVTIEEPGWQRVWVWLKSSINPTETKEGTTSTFQCPGGIDLSTPVAPGFTAGIPYHAVRLRQENALAKQSPTDQGDIGEYYLIGYYDTSGSREVAWCAPPMPYQPDRYSDATWAVHELGYITVTGVSLRASGSADLPDDEVMNIYRPADWRRHQAPVVELEHLGAHRIPTYMIWPGTGSSFGEWHYFGEDHDFEELSNSGGYSKLASVIINEGIPDCDGYTAVILLRIVEYPNTDGIARWEPGGQYDLNIQIRALNVTTAAQIVAGTADTLEDQTLSSRAWETTYWVGDNYYERPTAWNPVNQGIWAVDAFGVWALRGGCVGTNDMDNFMELTIDIPVTSITYPCDLVVEAKLGADVENAAVIAGIGIAAQLKGISVED